MSKIGRLSGKSQVFTVGGEEFEFKPLTAKDLDLIMDLSDDKKQAKAMKTLVTLYLKQADSEVTDEEIDNVSVEYINEISEAIMKVNGLDKK